LSPGKTLRPPITCNRNRIWLARRFDTRPFPDGDYRLDVEAADIRGNASRSRLVLSFVNRAREA